MAHLTAKQKADKERKDPKEEDPEFQIAPMIDILLVLMVFFMTISSTEVLQTNQDIVLPIAADAKPKGDKPPGQVIVNILWAEMGNIGAIEVDGIKFPQAGAIVPKLQDTIQKNPVARVLIRADKKVRYEYLKTVLRAVGDSGITNVTFSVVDKEGMKKP